MGELADTAKTFLEAFARQAQSRFGERPTRVQRSTWWVRDRPTSAQTEEHEREVFARNAVEGWLDREVLRSDWPELHALTDAVARRAVERTYIPYGLIRPLPYQWLADAESLADLRLVHTLSVQFEHAVQAEEATVHRRYAVMTLQTAEAPVRESVALEPGLVIRPIAEAELWELGDEAGAFRWARTVEVPSQEWSILEGAQTAHVEQRSIDVRPLLDLWGSALAALPVVSSGYLEVHILPSEPGYWFSGQNAYLPERVHRRLNSARGPYHLGASAAVRLVSAWPLMRGMLTDVEHPLHRPAFRLADGLARERLQDALLDFVIGLESLLLNGVRTELSYRFALRGAHLLASERSERRSLFNQLQELYRVRSEITHGGRGPGNAELTGIAAFAENALRRAWWRAFQEHPTRLADVLRGVDDAILGGR